MYKEKSIWIYEHIKEADLDLKKPKRSTIQPNCRTPSYLNMAVITYNKLPLEIKKVNSIKLFKKNAINPNKFRTQLKSIYIQTEPILKINK